MADDLTQALEDSLTWASLREMIATELQYSESIDELLCRAWPSGTPPRQQEVATLIQRISRLEKENERLRSHITRMSGEDT